jgi:hypothetical protein
LSIRIMSWAMFNFFLFFNDFGYFSIIVQVRSSLINGSF